MNDLSLYNTEDGRSQLKLRAQEQAIEANPQDAADLQTLGTQIKRCPKK